MLLEKQSHNFIRIGGCNSCHAQDLPSAAAALARARGIPSPRLIPQLPRQMENDTAERLMDLNTISLSGIIWQLFDSGMNRLPRDHYSDAAVRYIKMMQTPEGHWRMFENRRPPNEFRFLSGHGALDLCASALRTRGRKGRHSEERRSGSRVARDGATLDNPGPGLPADGSWVVEWRRCRHREGS